VLPRRHWRVLDVAEPTGQAAGECLNDAGEEIMSAVGMKCEACGGHSRVYSTRTSAIPNGIYRRRECSLCNHRWTTVEISADALKYILKRKQKSVCNPDLDMPQELGRAVVAL